MSEVDSGCVATYLKKQLSKLFYIQDRIDMQMEMWPPAFSYKVP